MKVSIKWLKRYVEIDEDPETLAKDLTMFGLNVEGIEKTGPDYTGVVFGRVTGCEKHPRADRLSVCRVDVGSGEDLNIVCGAPNVRKGLNVAVALNGAVLKDGFKIKKTKLRGEVSEGMICSETELGTGDDANGIIELDFDMEPGESLDGKLGTDDVIFDIEVTPNRPDQLCHIGIAREIAALYKRKMKEPEYLPLETGSDYSIEIENGDDCPRYTAALVDDVKVGESPGWLRDLLISVGSKPINNIVDITNFILLELGQPLHAFDRDTLDGDMIGVRRARPGENLMTLDDVERKLDGNVLVIADQENPVGIAGVMGGAATEVKSSTRRILIESAMFDPRAVRRSSQTLKLDTEASYRFEREGDIGITVRALERACWLIKKIGAGKPSVKYADRTSEGRPTGPRDVGLRVRQANRVMGTRLAADDLVELLERLELPSKVSGKDVLVSVPTFRRDLKEEIDLVEEAARVYGYENIGRDEDLSGNIFSRVSTSDVKNENLRTHLCSRGYTEVVTTSFMDPDDIVKFEWPQDDKRSNPVKIANPLTSAQSVLRTSLHPGLLKVISRNSTGENEGIRIFEIAKVFLQEGQGKGLPDEQLHLTAMFSGMCEPSQWTGGQRPFDFFDMKGEMEHLLDILGASSGVEMARCKASEPDFIFDLKVKDEVIARCGLIPTRIAARYDIESTVYFYTVMLDGPVGIQLDHARYETVIPYPAVKRDICVISSDKVTFADIRKVIKKRSKFLESIRLFDYYRGGNLGEGRRSYTFRMSFRSPDGTLEDNAVDRVIEKVLDDLRRELQVTLRTE